MGLSTTTFLPASIAWRAYSKWLSLGVVTTIRSQRGVREHGVEGAIGRDARITLGGMVGGAFDDGGQLQALDGGKQGRVKDAAAQTETD